jgi:hypothetical protein
LPAVVKGKSPGPSRRPAGACPPGAGRAAAGPAYRW